MHNAKSEEQGNEVQLSAEGIGLWQCQELQREFLYIRVVVVWLREDRGGNSGKKTQGKRIQGVVSKIR